MYTCIHSKKAIKLGVYDGMRVSVRVFCNAGGLYMEYAYMYVYKYKYLCTFEKSVYYLYKYVLSSMHTSDI